MTIPPYERSFDSHPRVSCWHPIKNGDIKPRNFWKNSHTTCWFKCDKCPHDFEMSLSHVNQGKWCPYCAVPCKKLCDEEGCQFCYERSFASHPKASFWHPTKNGDKKPRNVTKGSHQKCWFDCDKCPHDFEMSIGGINVGRWCSYCTNQKLCEKEECQFCYEKSFASHPRASRWHPTKNSDITPRAVFKSSHQKCWFDCDKCPHDFEMMSKSVKSGRWCPYCAVPCKKLCDEEGCQFCYERSFASHPKASCWHPTKNGDITPRGVSKSSHQKCWFDCDKCPHDFEMMSKSVKSGRWCPYCAVPCKKLCDEEGCQFCYERSFASHPKASCWHPTKNGDKKPRNVMKVSNQKSWFYCDKYSHDFEMYISNVYMGSWCPICKNKTEQKLYEALIGYHRGTKIQFRAKWCTNSETGRCYPFDFCIKSKKVIIELDGIQHFEDVKHWNSSFEDRHSIDLVKQLDANDNGYRVIRIVQEDVWTDRYDWLTELLKNIQDDTHQNVFMCKDGEYDFFIESINHLKSASAV